MKNRFFLYFPLLFLVANIQAQGLKIGFKTDIQNLNKENLIVEIRINGEKNSRECNTPIVSDSDIETFCSLDQNIHTIFIKILYTGKKPLSFIFDSTSNKIQKRNKLYVLNIGKIKFLPSETIDIVNIKPRIFTGNLKGYRGFSLTVHNPFNNPILVSSIQIRGEKNYIQTTNFFSEMGDSISFIVDPNLKITSFEGAVAKGITTIKDPSLNKASTVPGICKVGFNERMSYDYINFDFFYESFLPARQYKDIYILIPDSFNTIFSENLTKNKKLIKVKKFKDFEKYKFTLVFTNINTSANVSKTFDWKY